MNLLAAFLAMAAVVSAQLNSREFEVLVEDQDNNDLNSEDIQSLEQSGRPARVLRSLTQSAQTLGDNCTGVDSLGQVAPGYVEASRNQSETMFDMENGARNDEMVIGTATGNTTTTTIAPTTTRPRPSLFRQTRQFVKIPYHCPHRTYLLRWFPLYWGRTVTDVCFVPWANLQAITYAKCTVCVLIACCFAACSVESRVVRKRSDDNDPIKPVVEQLTAQVDHLQALVQANKNSIDNAQQTVGFTVRTVTQDVHGLGRQQTIKFDNVLYDAGGGYSPSTGLFIAPVSGTYVFFLQTLLHGTSDSKVYLDILKNGQVLARVHAGYSNYENGSSLAVTHLQPGDEIHVQISVGTSFTGGPYTTFAGFRVSPH